MKIRKAVFPAAGLGTRFLPATKAQPKEMLPLVDKPIIQYVIEEAVAAGLTKIIIVTGRGKNAIEDHFDTSYELEKMLEARGKTDLLEQVRAVSNMINVSYVRQGESLGLGHAGSKRHSETHARIVSSKPSPGSGTTGMSTDSTVPSGRTWATRRTRPAT